VHVVMAIHKPDMEHLRAQVASLTGQNGVFLRITAVLDGCDVSETDMIRRSLEGAVSAILVSPVARGPRAAFAQGLKHAVETSGEDCLFAYCDQDDVWHPDKLARLSAALEQKGAELVYCDARLVDDEGGEIAPSLHAYESREEAKDLLQHLLLNAVSGMTAIFTRKTALLALTLMDEVVAKDLLHDHLTVLAAASLGQTNRLAEPLVDYVQHADNALGAKPYRRKRRKLGVGPLSLYRAKSRAMFNQRRSAAQALARAGVLPRKLEAMFLTRRPGGFELASAYVSSIVSLLAQGQYRRAMLCIRMGDAAVSQWMEGNRHRASI
jgi:O-antigen biosynthesis protein